MEIKFKTYEEIIEFNKLFLQLQDKNKYLIWYEKHKNLQSCEHQSESHSLLQNITGHLFSIENYCKICENLMKYFNVYHQCKQ